MKQKSINIKIIKPKFLSRLFVSIVITAFSCNDNNTTTQETIDNLPNTSGDPSLFSDSHGPQGDTVRIYNYFRLIRNL